MRASSGCFVAAGERPRPTKHEVETETRQTLKRRSRDSSSQPLLVLIRQEKEFRFNASEVYGSFMLDRALVNDIS